MSNKDLFLTWASHCGKGVYDIQSTGSPCQILVCGSVKDLKPRLEMDYSCFVVIINLLSGASIALCSIVAAAVSHTGSMRHSAQSQVIR